MTLRLRKSKTFGPLRFTMTGRGLSVSLGWGPFRVSLGSDRKVHRTVRLPGTGVYDTETIGDLRGER